MPLSRAPRNLPLIVLFAAMAVSLAALALVPAIPQDQGYHQFVDGRTLSGIPNFWNVASNVLFVLIGAVGLWQCRGDTAVSIFFAGVLLTGFGSAYYHWAPSDATLLWDRLPMALAFSALLCAAIKERIDARAGDMLLWPLLALGVFSLAYWRWTDDLRLYGWVQFFPCAALVAMVLLLPAKYSGTWYWIAAAGLYVLAKLCEHFDRAIFATGLGLSGHTLKHVLAAAACLAILRYYQTRKPIA